MFKLFKNDSIALTACVEDNLSIRFISPHLILLAPHPYIAV